jgi:SAM-dependent methyltransferase
MRGTVIDLGGKKLRKRGTFRPPEAQSKAWWYANLDLDTKPNIYSDVTAVPLAKESADVIICTEVLEHVVDPGKCVREIYRLLKRGGISFASAPFLYPVHADPFDFQRFTADGLKHLFRDFSSVEIINMGGYLGVLGMFLELMIPDIEGGAIHIRAARRLLRHLGRFLCWLDLAQNKKGGLDHRFTTGYFVVAQR